MANDTTPDYYSLLGVSQSADSNQLKKAFRKKALENHPDRLNHLSEGERKKRVDLMYQINEAYGVLSDPEKKQVYNRQSKERSRRETTEGKTTTSRAESSRAIYNDFFNNIFKDGGIFGNKVKMVNGLWETPINKQNNHDHYFMIPETDWGLLVALKKAYKAKEDGKWRVKKAEDDERDWMPEEVYSVKRKGDNVSVFRVITDWRSMPDRRKKIEVIKKDAYREKEKEMNPNTFLGEYYLYGEGKNKLIDSEIPLQYGEYLGAMKSIAYKLVRNEIDNESNKYDISRELEVVNHYGEYGSRSTQVERKYSLSNDKDKEWVRKVTFDDFWKRMRQAEGTVVQVDGLPKSKEGQTKSPTEGIPSDYTGREMKG